MLKRSTFSFLCLTALSIASANSREIKYWHSEHYRGFERSNFCKLTDDNSKTDITEIRLCFDNRPLSENQSGLATRKDKAADFCQHFRDDPLLENSIDPLVSKQIPHGHNDQKERRQNLYLRSSLHVPVHDYAVGAYIQRRQFRRNRSQTLFSSGNMLSIVQKVRQVLLGDDYINLYWNYAGKPRVSSASIPETSQCFQKAFLFYWEKLENSCVNGVLSMSKKEVSRIEYRPVLKEYYSDLRDMLKFWQENMNSPIPL